MWTGWNQPLLGLEIVHTSTSLSFGLPIVALKPEAITSAQVWPLIVQCPLDRWNVSERVGMSAVGVSPMQYGRGRSVLPGTVLLRVRSVTVVPTLNCMTLPVVGNSMLLGGRRLFSSSVLPANCVKSMTTS